MFEFIRTHNRLMQFFLLLLIFPSFVLVGISSYKSFGNDADTVAKVGDQAITQHEWDAAQRQQMDRYRQMLGAQFDQKMFETPEAKQNVLDMLIVERAMTDEINRSHLTASDMSVAQTIKEQFPLTGPDGKFDVKQYTALLAAQGITADQNDARIRQALARQQLDGAIQGSGFAPKTVANQISMAINTERETQELLLPAADYTAQVKVTDDMVKAYYDKHAAEFSTPEQVKVDYVVFSRAMVEGDIAVPDAEVADYYAKNTKRYTADEQRHASHILINVKKDASAAEKSAAKAKAEAILAEVRKTPADFAKIAKAQSQDPASAELGGDLGPIEKGSLPKPVEDAVYGMKQGEISGVIASEFGFHIVTVTAVKPASVKPLGEVKADIVAELKKQKSSKKYSEMAEAFTNTVYEQSESLKPAADKLKLKVETIANLARTPSPALGTAPFNSPKFLKAVFSDDVLKNKHNTEAVEVAPDTLIAGHVVEYKPAAKRPLAEVDAAIRQRVTLDEATKLAVKAGAAKLAAFKSSGDATGFGEAKMVSRGKQPPFNGAAALAVLKADVSKLPAYVGIELPGQGYGIYRIGKVTQAAPADAAQHDNELQQINNAVAQQEMFAYIEALKVKAKVKVLKHASATDAKTGDAQ